MTWVMHEVMVPQSRFVSSEFFGILWKHIFVEGGKLERLEKNPPSTGSNRKAALLIKDNEF